MKIAFICGVNPEDRKAWSGSIYKMYEALLREGFKVEWIPIVHKKWEYKIVDIIAKLYYKIFNRKYNIHQDLIFSYFGGKTLAKKLNKSGADVIYAPACVNELAFLRTNKPIVYFNDANARQLINYNYALFNIGFLSKKITEFIEKRALNNVAVAAFSSEWASDFAMKYYKISPDKIVVAKLGSNADVPNKFEYNKNLFSSIKFLFLAAAWERKGGDIALNTINELHSRGYNIHLTIVGCVPPITEIPKYVSVYPFLNRNIPEEKEKIEQLLAEHHIMFVPTRSDAYGLIYVEGAAYGMPSVAPQTGGVPSIIDDGYTGILLPFTATPREYAEKIINVYLKNPEKIKQHGLRARKKYEDELNWDRWGKIISKRIKDIIMRNNLN